jgi:hypothetical protein
MSDEQTEQLDNAQSHDENVDSSTTTEAEATNETVAETSATETQEVKKNPVQERINQLTREKYEARQETAALEERLKALESKQPEEVKQVPKAPSEYDFDDNADYQTANSEYIASQAANAAYDRISQENSNRDKAAKDSQRVEALKAQKAGFDKNLDSKRGNFQDFEEVAYGHQFMNEGMATRIFGMDKGPEVAYHLGTNLDVAEKVMRMSPVDQAVELAKIEMQVDALKPKLVSDAPDVISPLQGSEKVQKDQKDMGDAEWLEWRYQQINARNK